MIIRIEGAVTLIAQNPMEGKQLVKQWIKGLLNANLIIDGEIIAVETIEEDLELDEPFFDFDGYDNYPGRPL